MDYVKNIKKYKVMTPDGYKIFDGIRKLKKECIKIYFDNDWYIDVSTDHIFMVNGEKIISNTLKMGDLLEYENGLVSVFKTEIIGLKEVYDLVNVEGNNIYYTNSIVSHNCEFIGSSLTVLSSEILKYLTEKEEIDPLIIDLNGKFRIYKKPEIDCNYLMGCLPPEELVLTKNGYKQIKDIYPNETLFDKNGIPTKILNKQIYNDINEDIFEINIFCNSRPKKFTGEHPLYVSKQPKLKKWRKESTEKNTYNKRYRDFDFKYIKTNEIENGDWVRFPNIYKNNILNNFEIENKWLLHKGNTRIDFEIKNPLIDNDFWWFVGIWLGDGWIQNHKSSYSIHTCFNPKKQKDVENAYKVKDIIKKYDRKSIVFNKNSCLYNQFTSKEIYHFLLNNFKQYSYGKEIPEWVKHLPNDKKLQLIKGYLESDGCVIRKRNTTTMNFVSVSLNLLEGIQDILFSLNHLSNLSVLREKGKKNINGKDCNIRKTYKLDISNYDSVLLLEKLNMKTEYDISKRRRNIRYSCFNKDNTYIYFKIRSIKNYNYKGVVYNFETDSGEFLCRNITTHNCDVAKGTGGDYSTIQILKLNDMNPLKLEQVAVYEDNMIDPYHFSEIVNRMSYYYNNAYILVENNSEGSTVVSQLHWEFENENLVNTGQKIKDLGVRATKNTKPKAVILMKKLIEDGSLEIIDKKTITQLSDFTDNGNNKYSCLNLNDDLVAALYWTTFIFELDILENSFGLKKIENENEDDDCWGILGDVDIDQEDWSWI